MSRTKRNQEMCSSRRVLREWHYLRGERERRTSYIRTNEKCIRKMYRIVGWTENSFPISEIREYVVDIHRVVLNETFWWEDDGFETYEDCVASHIRDLQRDGSWVRGRIEKYWSVQANRRARHNAKTAIRNAIETDSFDEMVIEGKEDLSWYW